MSQITTPTGVIDVPGPTNSHAPNSHAPRPQPSPSTDPPPGHPVIRWLVIIVLIGLGVAGYFWWQHNNATQAKAAADTKAPRPTPVLAAKARLGDLPIYVECLGNVIAFNNVVIRTRVDGELTKVAFVEGQIVKQGDLLAEIDPRPYQVQLEMGQGQKARDEALLANAKLDYQRYKEAETAIPHQQIDTAAATVAQYEAAVRVDQSQIDSAQLQLTYCRILAPLTGAISLRYVDQGNMVHATDANGLASITQLEPIAVTYSLPQDYLPQVQAARAKGDLLSDAYDRDYTTRLAQGKLIAIDNQINVTTGTVLLKSSFDNKDHALFPNQFVNIRLLVDTKKNVVLVPAAAVQRSPNGNFVFLIGSDDAVSVQPIVVGATEGDTTVVTEGLAAGQMVVTDGVDKLQEGSKVVMRDAGSGAGKGGKSGAGKKTPDNPAGAKPGDMKSPGANPADAASTDTKSGDTKSGDAKAGDTKPTDNKPKSSDKTRTKPPGGQ